MVVFESVLVIQINKIDIHDLMAAPHPIMQSFFIGVKIMHASYKSKGLFFI